MVITPGGLLVLAMFLILFTISSWSAWKYIRENESLKAEEQAADEKLEDIELENRIRRLWNADWNDLDWPDSVCRSYRNIAKTPGKAICRLVSARKPHNLVEHRLQAMAQCGYVGVVDREEVRTDGGDGGSEPRIADAQVVPEDEVPEGAETHDLSAPSEAFVSAVVADCGETVRDFDLVNADIDASKIHVEEAPMGVEELMHELDAQSQDFEDVDEWGDYMLEFVEFVNNHQFTDEHGSPDEIQFILNQWMDTDDVLADVFGFPHFKLEGDALRHAIDQRDPVDEASQLVDEINDGLYS